MYARIRRLALEMAWQWGEVEPCGRLERAEVLDGGARTRRLVDAGQAPPGVLVTGGDRDEVLLDLAGGVGGGGLVLGAHGIGVAAFLGQARVAVVEVLRRLAHDQGRGVDEPLGEDPRVGVDALTHRVAPHVLDAAGDADVDGAHGDGPGDRRHRGHGPSTHPVDGVSGRGVRQTREEGRDPAEGQALVADLGRRCDGDLLDPLLGQVGVAAEQLADALDDEVVGAGLGVDALVAGLAVWRTHAVDEDDLSHGAGHGASLGFDGQDRERS